MLTVEQLVLLRAQAYIETGDLTSARADINDVRTSYGLADARNNQTAPNCS